MTEEMMVVKAMVEELNRTKLNLNILNAEAFTPKEWELIEKHQNAPISIINGIVEEDGIALTAEDEEKNLVASIVLEKLGMIDPIPPFLKSILDT